MDREFAGDILHAGRHLMDVITDILDIAKAQSGTIELQKRMVRPEAVMRAARADRAREGTRRRHRARGPYRRASADH